MRATGKATVFETSRATRSPGAMPARARSWHSWLDASRRASAVQQRPDSRQSTPPVQSAQASSSARGPVLIVGSCPGDVEQVVQVPEWLAAPVGLRDADLAALLDLPQQIELADRVQAEPFGAQGIVVPGREAAGLSPAALKASAGAAHHLPVCRVANLQKALQKTADRGLFIAGLDAAGDRDFTEIDFAQACALVIGSEGKGLRRMVQKRCDALLQIPMAADSVGSFNASVAASIVLYEVFRQRQ